MKATVGQEQNVLLIIEKEDSEYWVTVQSLPGCYASGATIEEAISNAKEAITDHISALRESEDTVPEVFLNENYQIQIKYDLKTLFERFNVINKTALAEKAGINSSLLRQYSIGLAFASEKQKLKIENAIHDIGSSLLEVCL
jgi:predicted RNase H-like HicB family nuclease